MASLKSKDLQNMSEENRNKKLKELKLELIKARVGVSKTGSSKIKEIKKIIARIHTFNKSSKKEELNKK